MTQTKTMVSGVLLLSVLLLAGFGCRSNSKTDVKMQGNVQTNQGSTYSTSTRSGTTSTTYMDAESRMRAAAELDARVNDVRIDMAVQMDMFNEKLNNLKGTAKTIWTDTKAALDQKITNADRSIEQLRDATGEGWVSAKLRADAAVEDLEASYTDIKADVATWVK
ncbi:MAG TPA: hypothetical protein VEA18_00915 [Candidatus Kapabacteria bacterium]|nr:hypothetical protein [Candidatus Kapabacteria bacterium]